MITFFLVPLYTRYLTTAQYGVSDVVNTIVSLLTPILTLSIIEAVFRFALDKKFDNGKVLTNSFFVSLLSFIVFLILIPVIYKVNYAVYVVFLTYASALESTLQQFARGIGKSFVYAITGLFMTLVTVFSNVFFIVLLGWQLKGFLISLLIAQIAGIMFLVVCLKAWNYVKFSNLDMTLVKSMLIYSMPLIPNMVSWWLSNSANKIFISILLGATANGIYAVANKIPSLISVFYSIFTQAWQISAVEEYKNKDAGKFFGSVFTATFGILIVGVSLITLFSKELVLILSTNAYFEAWKVVPWLALAVLFSSLSSFLGTIYTSSMKTMALFTTTLVGGIINVICNLLLIPIFGIIGAGIGACVSFLCVALIRLKDSKKFISIKLEWLPIILSFFILSIEIIILFFMNGLASFLFMALCVVILFVINGFPFFKLLKNHIR